jgi:membrane-associated phospholipid phosphatase
VHYPLDVVVGAVCGIAFGELTVAYLDRGAGPDAAACGWFPTGDRPAP